jgi:hypothetical protein
VKPRKPAILSELESQLFIVRMWREDLGDGQSEWRAHIRHVPDGDERYVRTWQDLEIFLGRYNDRSDPNNQSIK